MKIITYFLLIGCIVMVQPAAWAGGALSAGERHALRVMPDGSVWSWGLNRSGQLGRGEPGEYLPAPAPIPGITDAVQVAAGWEFTLVLRRDGSVWQVGAFNSLPLRNWDLTEKGLQRVQGLANIVAISAGNSHSLALQSDGTVWAWGSNNYGQLGTGATSAEPGLGPVRVLGGAVSVAAAGASTSYAVMADGMVLSWGDNSRDLTGNPVRGLQPEPRPVPGLSGVRSVAAGQGLAAALKSDGTVWVWGSDVVFALGYVASQLTPTHVPAPVPGLAKARAISVGSGDFIALLEDGRIWSTSGLPSVERSPGGRWTGNAIVPDLAKVVAIAGGSGASLAVQEDGSMWGWRHNTYSLLNVEGAPMQPNPLRVPGLKPATAISAGRDHTLAVLEDGSVLGWGDNGHGQLGAGHVDNPAAPERAILPLPAKQAAAGRFFSDFLIEDGSVWRSRTGVWPNIQPLPVRVGGLSDVVALSADLRSLGLQSNGTVWEWDDTPLAAGGAAGAPAPVASQVPGLGPMSAISEGLFHRLSAGQDGLVWAWGNGNSFGQLGIAVGEPFTPGTPLRVPWVTGGASVSAGREHSLAVMANGTLWSWGSNAAGELGLNSRGFTGRPAQVRGLRDVVAAEAGARFSLAVRRDGTVWMWGRQIGDPRSEGTVVGMQALPAPAPLPWFRNATRISAAEDHALVLDAEGSVWGWGLESLGQLGQGGKLNWAEPAPSLPFGLPDARVLIEAPGQTRFGARALIEARVGNQGAGPSEADWSLEVHLSPGLRGVQASGADWTCQDPAGRGLFHCTRKGVLQPGEDARLRIEVEVVREDDPEASTSVSIGVRVTLPADRYPGNDAGMAVLRVSP